MPFTKGHPGGPGRPKRADKYAGQVAKAEKRIADRLPVLVDKMLELADGVVVEDVNPVTGQVGIYREKPDRQALVYLIDRIMGKPTEHKEIDHHIDVSQLSDDELQSILKT